MFDYKRCQPTTSSNIHDRRFAHTTHSATTQEFRTRVNENRCVIPSVPCFDARSMNASPMLTVHGSALSAEPITTEISMQHLTLEIML
jgi:hypothetical protein